MVKGSLRALLFLTIPPPASLLHHPTATQRVASRPSHLLPASSLFLPSHISSLSSAAERPSPNVRAGVSSLGFKSCHDFPNKNQALSLGHKPCDPKPLWVLCLHPWSSPPLPDSQGRDTDAHSHPLNTLCSLPSLSRITARTGAQGHHHEASSADPLPVWAWRGSVRCSSQRILNFPAQHGVPWGRVTCVFHSCDPAQCPAHTGCSEGIRTNG